MEFKKKQRFTEPETLADLKNLVKSVNFFTICRHLITLYSVIAFYILR